jgi:hypothetical protein
LKVIVGQGSNECENGNPKPSAKDLEQTLTAAPAIVPAIVNGPPAGWAVMSLASLPQFALPPLITQPEQAPDRRSPRRKAP